MATTLNSRYILQKMLGEGGMGSVYHARDRLTGQNVALKRIRTLTDDPRDTPGTDFRLALTNEFRVLASLRHPHIIQVLDYGVDKGQPYFIMELLAGAQTILEAARTVSQTERIRMLLEVLQALTYLHRRGILHRDLKPGNVLVDQAGKVKVLDFGLSLMSSYSFSNIQQNTVGTLAYMAPELMSEEPASVYSDLYAVGVIACEVLTGHHPFNQKNVAALVHSILTSQPDLDGLDPNLLPILERLLEKEPNNRFSSAEEVSRALCEASQQTPPLETGAIRESFLQAARFVGRDKELRLLREALKQVVSESPQEHLTQRGSAWLVGGESGSGKSRLCEEVRIRAMIYGTLTVHGQAIMEGGTPYQLWHNPLRRLVLAVDISDEEAGVLKAIVSDIEGLLGHAVPELPMLDPQTSQTRLLKVVTDIFCRPDQPIMILLEDVQWAAEEDLILLKRLITLTNERPLLLLANYRNDEAPHLPEALPGTHVIRLERFDDMHVAELCEAMLGEAGQQAEMVSFLQRETEGNVFFLVEIVRALAENAGQLERVNDIDLGRRLMPQGIQDIVRRRLDRVPDEARTLLQLAAVAGRDLDLKVCASFESLYVRLTDGLDGWLAVCADAAVLEVHEQRWRFSHDRLREALVAELPTESLAAVHRQLGETLEHLYPNAAEQIPALATHFQRAGNHVKAARYFFHAGQIASAAFANDSAIEFFRSALSEYAALDADDQQAAEWRIVLVDLHERLGDVLELTGSHDAARASFQVANGYFAYQEVIGKARLLRKIGKTWESQRAYAEAQFRFASAIETLEMQRHTDEPSAWWMEWLENQTNRLVAYYWMNKPQAIQDEAEKMRSAFDQHGTPRQQRAFFLLLGLMIVRRDRYMPSEQAITYTNMALEIGEVWQATTIDMFWRFIVGFTCLWCGELDKAEQELQAGAAVLERIGDVTTLSRSLAYLTLLYRKHGQLDQVGHYAQRTLEVALAGQMTEYIASAKGHQAWVAFRENNFTEALRLGDEGKRILMMQHSPVASTFAWIVLWPLIASQSRLGQLAEAIESIQILLDPSQQPQPSAIQAELEKVVQAWERRDSQSAQTHFAVAIDLAPQWGYI